MDEEQAIELEGDDVLVARLTDTFEFGEFMDELIEEGVKESVSGENIEVVVNEQGVFVDDVSEGRENLGALRWTDVL